MMYCCILSPELILDNHRPSSNCVRPDVSSAENDKVLDLSIIVLTDMGSSHSWPASVEAEELKGYNSSSDVYHGKPVPILKR